MDIKPIETVYNGYRFRSRLEARWAVFFDAAGIKYEYEPEGFDLGDGIYYLPDFYLPDDDVWVEIKGKALSAEERKKIERFCINKCDFVNSGTRFRLLEGQIPNGLLGTDKKPLGIPCFIYASPDELVDGLKHLAMWNGIHPKNGVLMFGAWVPSCGLEKASIALDIARQARFEHGEKPRVGATV